MKLAEALMTRADLQRRFEQLRSRIQSNARFQEGEEPTEDAAARLVEASALLEQIESLVVAINLSNTAAVLPDGRTITACLARRESLHSRHALLTTAANAAQGDDGYRQLRSELRQLPALPVVQLRRQADEVAREPRELDVEIQRANWEVDLQE